ncbi:MAG: DUF4403 family protein [Chromatiales bacterium]|nr:DUF4403 family protein [Chromatiales bacterium]
MLPRYFPRFLFLTIFFALTAVPATAQPPAPESHLSLAVDLSLQGILKSLEEHVPREANAWGRWHEHNGVQVQYRVWRGPIRLAMQGSQLLISVDLGYRLKAQKRLLKIATVGGSCGVGEPARAARLTVSLGLSVTPDWRLRAAPRLLPLTFGAPCLMTALNVDVTPLLRNTVERELGKALRTQLSERAAQDTRLRDAATTLWQHAQRPNRIADGVWLSARPQAIRFAPPRERADGIGLDLNVTTSGQLSTRLLPSGESSPLPELEVVSKIQPGYRFHMDFDVDEQGAAPLLEGALSLWGPAAAVLSVKAVQFRAKQVELSIRALGEGPYRLVFQPRLDQQTGQLSLRLHSDEKALSALPLALRWLIKGLADTDWPLNPLLDQLAKSAQDELSGEIATNIVLKSQIESVRPDRLEMADGSLKLGIWIEGNSQISLR